MEKKILKGFLVLFVLVGIVFSLSNFVAPKADAAGGSGFGLEIVDEGGEIIDCTPGGNACTVTSPKQPKD
ncbi:MAG: hypothetical protein QG657_4811 [Acidobacteriota bacterium]|nr:hypothetical protein [Acidobacteriota bacterium]